MGLKGGPQGTLKSLEWVYVSLWNHVGIFDNTIVVFGDSRRTLGAKKVQRKV